MITRCKASYPLLLLAVLLFISACTPVTGTSGSSLTVLQVLQNSAQAMKQLKSAHVETQTTGTLQTIAPAIPTPTTTAATPTTTTILATPTPTTATLAPVMFTLKGSGDEALPTQQSLQLAVTSDASNRPTNLAEVIQGDMVYIQNTHGQWFVLNKSALAGFTGDPFSSINGLDPNALLGLLENTQIIDRGDEPLNGQSLRHITITLDKAGFQKILDSDPQLGNLFGQQNLTTILNSTQTFASSLDLWIDETNFYVHRTELKVNLATDIRSLSASLKPVVTFPLPPGVITSFDSTLDLSKFNTPVTITAPLGAIPTDNPSSVFS